MSGRSFSNSPVDPPSSVTQTMDRVFGNNSFRPENGSRIQDLARLSPPTIVESPVPPPKTTTFRSRTSPFRNASRTWNKLEAVSGGIPSGTPRRTSSTSFSRRSSCGRRSNGDRDSPSTCFKLFPTRSLNSPSTIFVLQSCCFHLFCNSFY